MGFLDLVNQLISEHGSATILKERLLLLRDQLEQLEKENQRLREENQTLQENNDELNEQLESESKTEEFVKHRGVLFLRLPNGNIQDEVYCPRCHRPMNSIEDFLPFQCEPCNFMSGFRGRDLRSVISEIS